MADAILATHKQCSMCGEIKQLSEFSKQKTGKFGVRGLCKICHRLDSKKWRQENPNWHKDYRAGWSDEEVSAERKRNADRSDQKKQYYAKHKDRINAYCLAYAKSNPQKYAARAMARLTLKARATPPWADFDLIEKVYEQAASLNLKTGMKWHVDHIVPLKSKYVCGLHVQHNLAVLPAEENISKSNRYWPNMP